MTIIDALQKALPFSGLEPATLCMVQGFGVSAGNRRLPFMVEFFEPPLGHATPFIDPRVALQTLGQCQGLTKDAAQAQAERLCDDYLRTVNPSDRVRYLDDWEPNSAEHVPAESWLTYLRNTTVVPTTWLDFLDRAAVAATHAPIFPHPEVDRQLLSLSALPAVSQSKFMTHFMPGPPWAEPSDERDTPEWEKFLAWRESMVGVNEALKTATGADVYYFSDLDDPLSDDYVHRFLVLHWCCCFAPESAYVQYILQASGAADVDALKRALVDPESYKAPYTIDFYGVDTMICRLTYQAADATGVVAIVFDSLATRQQAEALLWSCINVDVLLAAPSDLLTEDWLKQWDGHLRHWRLRYSVQDDGDHECLNFLSRVSRVNIVIEAPAPWAGNHEPLTSWHNRVLTHALRLKLPVKIYNSRGYRAADPERHLVDMAATKARDVAASSLGTLAEVHVYCDVGLSGIWDAQGNSVAYDFEVMPFELVQRFAAWQWDYDKVFKKPNSRDEIWWSKHNKEGLCLAQELQQLLVGRAVVKVGGNALILARRDLLEVPSTGIGKS